MSTLVYGGLVNGLVKFGQNPGSGVFSGAPFQIPAFQARASYGGGTAADKIDGVSFVELSLAASTPLNIDLQSLIDFQNNAITAARARYFFFSLLNGVDGQKVKIGNYGGNEFNGFVSSGGTISVYPGTTNNDGWIMMNAPNTTAMPINSGQRYLKCDPGTTAATLLAIIGTASV